MELGNLNTKVGYCFPTWELEKSQQVVFYDNISGMSSARGVWLLHYFSHKKVSLLDGGLDRWKEEGYPLETKTNAFVKTNLVGKPNPKVLAPLMKLKSL